MVITVLEKYNGRYYMSDYKFRNEEQKQQFIKLCEDSNCLVIERKIGRREMVS